jgi:urea transport system permease protein
MTMRWGCVAAAQGYRWMRAVCLALSLLAGLGWAPLAHGLQATDARSVVEGDSDERIAAIGRLIDGDERAHALLRALADEAVRVQEDRVLILRDGQAFDAVTGEAVSLSDAAEEVTINNRLRGALQTALAVLDLSAADEPTQIGAAERLRATSFDNPDPLLLPVLDHALAGSLPPRARDALVLARAAILLAHDDETLRLQAAAQLAQARSPAVRPLLQQRLQQESSPAVRAALQASLTRLERALQWSQALGQWFAGISLGSILLLAALGLAITYGLMGVINMAHGELIMIGAYATWLVQAFFRQWWPHAFDWYLLVALPVSFGVAALVGAAMERGVIRFLYGRPLETLLATWGLSLVLMQGVRSLFGAQNVSVENPAWMSGSLTLMGNLTLPWNRVVIVLFALAVLAAVALLIARTRLGLFVRAVTQNRPMASCMGVPTARIDTYAFALGSGVAGLAGCALSQIGNVGPDLGQAYIVDSFLVVVLGGVGQLAGTVVAALGLGVLNKWLEGWMGAVLAKIAVLVLIVFFIQKRPQGIFALKGRQA